MMMIDIGVVSDKLLLMTLVHHHSSPVGSYNGSREKKMALLILMIGGDHYENEIPTTIAVKSEDFRAIGGRF